MRKILFLTLLVIPLIFDDCDNSGALCTTANKDVTVTNNTGFDLQILQVGPQGALVLGPMTSFEQKTYKFPPNFIIRAISPGGGFSRELFITECKQDWELIVER